MMRKKIQNTRKEQKSKKKGDPVAQLVITCNGQLGVTRPTYNDERFGLILILSGSDFVSQVQWIMFFLVWLERTNNILI